MMPGEPTAQERSEYKNDEEGEELKEKEISSCQLSAEKKKTEKWKFGKGKSVEITVMF